MSIARGAAVFAEPTRRVPGRWIACFAAAWLGVWMAQLTPIQLLLPLQVQGRLHTDAWLENVLAFGVVSGISGACAVIAYPLTGALSDRTTGRFGRRRPWIAAGAAIFALGLVVLGAQTTMVGIGVLWSIVIIGFCMLTAALTATISDQVPVDQRGYVSGWLSAPQAIGTILGILLITLLFTDRQLAAVAGQVAANLILAVLLIALVIPFLLLPDAVLEPRLRPSWRLRVLVEGFWISPRAHPDFGWTLLGRILVNFGNAFGTTLLLYFLEFGLRVHDAEDALLTLTLIYMVFVVVAALVTGRASDRMRRRKLFVFTASALQGAAALLLAFAPAFPTAMAAAGVLGLGYGCFLAVDQALATQVLPDPASRGKDLGIMNIATAVPQAVAPMLGAAVVVASGGFFWLFVMAGVVAIAGAFAVSRVKGVR